MSRTVCAILLLFAVVPLAHADDDPLKGFDEVVTKAMKDHQVPGLAIAIVKDDKVVLSKGYGVRTHGDPEPVTDQTLFAIGSSSKAFTAAALALLVDEGKVKWDDPVIKHMPTFQLHDPYVTREITVRDLLCHRSGLDRHELMWYGSPFDRDELVRRLRLVKPDSSFRSKFGYQNMMYLTAGQLVPAITKTSWDDFVKDRIFKPLGMKASNTSIKDLPKKGDVATPHDEDDDEKLIAIPWKNIDNIGPAGSINSSVRDMTGWVRLQLGDGTFEKNRVLGSTRLREMHASNTVIPVAGLAARLNPETHFKSYGLGWFLSDYRGKKVVEHGGNIDGMSAQVGLLPEEKLGLVILTNANGSALPPALMHTIFDRYLKAPPKDWPGDTLKVIQAATAMAKKGKKDEDEGRVKDTKPSLALEKYAGEYKDDLHAPFLIKHAEGKLTATFNGLTFALEHWHFNTFKATEVNKRFPKIPFSFDLNDEGKVSHLKAKLQATEELVFKRIPDPPVKIVAFKLTDEEKKKFVGKYEVKAPPIEWTVEFVGGQLTGQIAGQPAFPLVAVTKDRFTIEGLPVQPFFQFVLAEGKVKSVNLEQGPVKLIFEVKK